MSVQSQIPFFGQAWELVVQVQNADGGTDNVTISTNSWDPEALRITFEVLQSTISSPWWYADIVIYNLNATETQNILFNATWVTLKAGFQTGPALSSIIWDGPILQVLYDQENVVDQRVTLHCVANPAILNEGVVAFSMGMFSSQAQLLARAAAAINLPAISQANGTLSQYAAQALAAKQYPRGNTVFGKVGGYLSQIADDQFLSTFRSGYSAYMTDLGQPDAPAPAPDYVYAPPSPPNTTLTLPPGTTQTIIGTPRQTPEGVIFTVLLDPRLKVQLPVLVVRLVRVLPTQTTINPDANSQYVTPLNANLTFFVGQVRHTGDSRGNDWQTEVTGYNTTYGTQLLDGVFAASSAGG